MYTLNLDPAALVLSALCLIYIMTTRGQQYAPPKGLKAQLLSQHFVFMLLLLVSILSSAASVGSVTLMENPEAQLFFLQYFLLELYFVLHTTLAILFVLYVMNVNGTAIGRKKRFYWYFILPYALGELVTLSNPLTNLVFYLDGELVYHRGMLLPFLYCLAAVYVLTGIYFFIRYQRAIPRADSVAICSAVVLSLLGVGVQALCPDFLVELFAEALTILGFMVMLEDRSGATDPTTLVFSRRAFVDANRRYMETGQSYSILLVKLMDLDRYSRLFDSRDVDMLLVAVARWLETVTDRENIFRFGQEDFALTFVGRREKAAEEAARRILARFASPWKADETEVQPEAIVSIIRVPEDVDSLSQLQDLLLWGYQEARPGSLLVTHDELATLKRQLAVEDALRRALENRSLQVWYQPIWSSDSGTIVAAEALSRLIDDELGFIPPDEFIPIAEKTGMINELGAFAFEEVCRVLSDYRLADKGIHYLELNLSLYQLLREGVLEKLEKYRRDYGVAAAQINLEITESVSSDETPAVQELLRHLEELGYSFSLDDYGTGYSNLARLIEGSYTNVKIDKSLLWGGEKNPSTARLLRNMIRIIRSLDMNVVQEGVETREQLDRVVKAGCNLIQGYYFSKPLREADFIAFLDSWDPLEGLK
ncbi:MAG: EAL domain-containing protein [Oscillospiraceae bacterium]|nr:EAL domain-containing protein [Oscillospiraceae bacterium]